jgi:hypothetical protein
LELDSALHRVKDAETALSSLEEKMKSLEAEVCMLSSAIAVMLPVLTGTRPTSQVEKSKSHMTDDQVSQVRTVRSRTRD